MSIYILIPAYNEAETISSVIAGLIPLGHRIVVINDASKDTTAAIARNAGATVLSHCVNLGQGAALQTGMEYARSKGAEVIITFDADGQHQPSDIARLLDALQDADIALGSRFLGEALGIHPVRRLVLKLMTHYTNFMTGLTLTDVHNGLRAMKVSAIRSINLKQNRMAHASEILSQVAQHKLRCKEVPCTIIYTPYSRAKGQKLFHAIHIFADLLLQRLYR